MSANKFCLGLLILVVSGFTLLSLTQGQERPLVPPAAKPPTVTAPSVPKAEPAAKALDRDLSKLSVFHRQIYLSAQRGADWLQRANRPDGLFVYGYHPTLRSPMEGDDYLRQVGAAFGLARAARFFKEDDRMAAIATQAVLRLLADTTCDPKDKTLRYTSVPFVNRLAAAGMLVMAVHELPTPQPDLLEQADQLCNYLRSRQRPDGSFHFADDPKANEQVEAVNLFSGPAVYALVKSHQQRPAAWKLDAVRKALPHYHKWWREHKNTAMLPWHTAAYIEVYLLTKEKAFADCVTEMNDWLCTLQYEQIDPRRPLWVGGFKRWSDGKAEPAAPEVTSALCAESLAEACRLARHAGDATRFGNYRQALEKCLQFLTTLQYTEANVQHFADWYRPVLVGAFHASHQEGDLRIDYNQHPVCAMVRYLNYVAELP
jgi:hypothetical protein